MYNFLRQIFFFKPLEWLLVKLTQGVVYGSFMTKLPPNHYQYSKNTIRTVTRNGIKYILDISDMVEWYIYFGFKEPSRQSLYKLIHKGYTFFDIGTNIGEVSLNAAKRVMDGQVYSFEPDKENFKKLQQNLKLNNYKNIHPINKGLGDKSDILQIEVFDQKNKGMNRIVNNPNNSDSTFSIEIITLDQFIEENKVNKIDLIKIDVEGYEMRVLLGAKKSIADFKPTFFIEIDDNNLKRQNNSARELIQFLENRNYNIKNCETGNLITSNSNFNNCHFDIICINQG